MEDTQKPRLTETKNPTNEYFIWLDWLRFGAALMVLFVHTRGFVFSDFGALEPDSKTRLTMLFFAFTRIGHESVIVFFVLSGFLVGGKLIERVSQENFDWRSYAIDRASRILVPMVPAIALAVAIDTLNNQPPKLINIIGASFFLEGTGVPSIGTIAPLWSLAYEAWFYILAGALAVAVSRRPVTSWGALIVLFISFSIFTKLSTVYLFSWIIGSLAYIFPRQRLSRAEVLISLSIIAIGLLMYQSSTASRSIHVAGWISIIGNQHLGELTLSAGFALLIRNLCTVVATHNNATLFGRLGVFLASFSYSLYLCHYPILTAMKNFGYRSQNTVSLQAIGTFVAQILICLIISYIFYWLFERNTSHFRLYMKKRLLQR